MKLEVREISPALAADFCQLHARPEFGGCFCRFWQFEGDNNAWGKTTPEGNRTAKESEITSGQTRGALFYLDGKPIGWCQFAHRSFFKKMNANPSFVSTAADNIWSIGCMAVTKEARKKGLSKQMVEEILKLVAKQGGKTVEAYPRRDKKLPDEEVWMGPRRVFESLGFAVYFETPRYLIMRKYLDEKS
ncbi:MAG: GNAT family N-acetyltransferase [candidate division Zixibacteria bacterium]|nr:GNAT family N-acetyltransferase [candidate division Zixibacteria bacterium]